MNPSAVRLRRRKAAKARAKAAAEAAAAAEEPPPAKACPPLLRAAATAKAAARAARHLAAAHVRMDAARAADTAAGLDIWEDGHLLVSAAVGAASTLRRPRSTMTSSGDSSSSTLE